MTRWVLHVDLDQFIAAVEVLRRPELRGKPVVVGGDGDPTKRGVVSTASYEARAHGVTSGTPLRTALKRCPDAIFLPVDKEAYEAASVEVMAALRRFPAVVQVMGWDEAFMEVYTEDPEALARSIQQAVRDNTRLECSIGIGENRLQAKLATGFGKPAGVFRLTSANWFEVLGDRGPDALWGIGAKTAKRLADLGITTVRQLATTDHKELAGRLGPTLGPWYVLVARGVDRSPVESTPWVPRSAGHEVTYQRNLIDAEQVRGEVDRLARMAADSVAADGRPAIRMVVKVRFAPFFTRTHGVPLAEPTKDPQTLAAAARAALDRFDDGRDRIGERPIRLLGVRAEFADPGRG